MMSEQLATKQCRMVCKYQDHWSNEQLAVSHSTVVLLISTTNKAKKLLIEKRWEVYILVDLPATYDHSFYDQFVHF